MRIEEVHDAEANPVVRATYAISRRMYGTVPRPLRAFARSPLLMEGYSMLELAFSRTKKLDSRIKALAQIKTAALVGCEYCLDIGSWEGQQSGVTAEQIAELPRHHESDRFSPAERAALDYAVAMTRTPVEVSDALFEELRTHFSDDQLVELTTAVALENLRGRFNWALDIPPQGFAEGMVCAVPEREPQPAT